MQGISNGEMTASDKEPDINGEECIVHIPVLGYFKDRKLYLTDKVVKRIYIESMDDCLMFELEAPKNIPLDKLKDVNFVLNGKGEVGEYDAQKQMD